MTDDEFDPSHPYVRRQGRAGGGRQKGQVMTTNTNAALREKLIDLIAEHLSGTYHCTRVWEAWNVGTMSQDDFEDVGESDTPPELADAILAALSHCSTPPAADLAGDGDSTKDEIRMTDNKQYPELPTHFMLVQESFRDEVYLYTADQMRAYADADRAMRATKAAPQICLAQPD